MILWAAHGARNDFLALAFGSSSETCSFPFGILVSERFLEPFSIFLELFVFPGVTFELGAKTALGLILEATPIFLQTIASVIKPPMKYKTYSYYKFRSARHRTSEPPAGSNCSPIEIRLRS